MISPTYLDPDQPIAVRVCDLISHLTLDEKIDQMMNDAPAIPRLGIPAYNWWNECLHGVARAGIATVFPQAIGLASTWDMPLIGRIAQAISDEARAKHHTALRQGDTSIYRGLTCWSPNINIFRDPRWGRGQETYGEDPYLTARLGVAFVKGLQGEDERYLKLVATPKHFAVHSGPEHARHHFDAHVSLHDLCETYLPAFKACVVEGKAVSIMGAYNRTNGEACCASPTLLERILREEWGFGGLDGTQAYVVSDCDAIRDIYKYHHVVETPAQAAALAVKNGCDLECGATFVALHQAIEQGLIEEADLERALERLYTTRFRLGMFDPPERVPYAQIPLEVNDCAAHRRLALQAARESIVLLKNDGLLPLDATRLKSIAVIGPNAADERVLWGNYNGKPSNTITILDGIRQRAGDEISVKYARGCEIFGSSQAGFAEAVSLAQPADLAVVVLGLSQLMEGEEGQGEGVQKGLVSRGDRLSLDLPGVQEQLLQAVHATGTPVVLVLVNGSALAVNWADQHVPAILETWYGGQSAGQALADALFGDTNPAGRLPVTFYKSVDNLPPFEDYNMQGRTYRYFHGGPLYPFGYGLSYTQFEYRNLQTRLVESPKTLKVSFEVTNAGQLAGDEVVQLYLQHIDPPYPAPIWQLVSFSRIHLLPGETRWVEFALNIEQLSLVDEQGKLVYHPGPVRLAAGGCSPGKTPTLQLELILPAESQPGA
jgi:beta-glucosidase